VPYEPKPGTRIRGVIDWYEVHDLYVLVDKLRLELEVVGCEKLGWIRLDPESRDGEPSATIELASDGRLEVTTATELAAETTRWWLERIAGEAVTYETGEVWRDSIGTKTSQAETALDDEALTN
jgi:hypothetical protein